MRLSWIMLGLALTTVLTTARVHAQAPIPTVSAACEQQVSEDYRQLVQEQVLVAAPGGQTWTDFLGTMTKTLRLHKTHVALLERQAQVQGQDARNTTAEIIEGNRRTMQAMSQELQALRSEVERLRASSPPLAPPAN